MLLNAQRKRKVFFYLAVSLGESFSKHSASQVISVLTVHSQELLICKRDGINAVGILSKKKALVLHCKIVDVVTEGMFVL